MISAIECQQETAVFCLLQNKVVKFYRVEFCDRKHVYKKLFHIL